jgi:hypothetical protein
MSSWLRPVLFPLLVVAALGFGLSVYIHVTSIVGLASPFGAATWGLHLGIFVVWLPTVLIAGRMTKGAPRKDFWKVALLGCPRWMRYGLYTLFAYAIVNFICFAATTKSGKQPLNHAAPPAVLRGFSGHWMVFYAAGFSVLFSAYRIGWDRLERKCPHGHIVSYSARFCDQCGTEIEETPLT